MRFIIFLIFIYIFSTHACDVFSAASVSSSSSSSHELMSEEDLLGESGIRVVGKSSIEFLGSPVNVEKIDPASLIDQKTEITKISYVKYVCWPGADKMCFSIIGLNIHAKIYDDSSNTVEHIFPLKGPIENAALSESSPIGVIQFVERGNKYINYIINFITGEMTEWFEGYIHYGQNSFTKDCKALYYIDTVTDNHWVFRHGIGEDQDKRIPLYNLSVRHPDYTNAIDPRHIILYVDEETGTIVYTNRQKVMGKEVVVSFKNDSGDYELSCLAQSSSDATTYSYEHKILKDSLFYISNEYGKDLLCFSRMCQKDFISGTRYWHDAVDADGTENTEFALDFELAIDKSSFAVKSRKEDKLEWEILKLNKNGNPFEGYSHHAPPKNTQEILSLKGNKAIISAGPDRFPPTLVETDITTQTILRVLQKATLAKGLYYPPLVSRTIASSIDGCEVHFLINLPPLFSGKTDQKRPYVLNLNGGPITEGETIENLRESGLTLAQKGIGRIFVNYRARHGRKLADIKSMCDADGQWNDYHIWDVVTVLHALQNAGIASEFILSGGSFDAHTVLAVVHGQEPDTGRFYGEGLNITGLILLSGGYCCDETHDPKCIGRRSKVRFENPKGKSIPTLALHGMHDWQCKFVTQGRFIENYLKSNPEALFIAAPDTEHNLMGNPDIDTFFENTMPKIIEKMALGVTDPFDEFQKSDLYQSFVDRYENAIKEQEQKRAVARRLLDSMIAEAVSVNKATSGFKEAQTLIKLRSLARNMVADIVQDVTNALTESASSSAPDSVSRTTDG